MRAILLAVLIPIALMTGCSSDEQATLAPGGVMNATVLNSEILRPNSSSQNTMYAYLDENGDGITCGTGDGDCPTTTDVWRAVDEPLPLSYSDYILGSPSEELRLGFEDAGALNRTYQTLTFYMEQVDIQDPCLCSGENLWANLKYYVNGSEAGSVWRNFEDGVYDWSETFSGLSLSPSDINTLEISMTLINAQIQIPHFELQTVYDTSGGSGCRECEFTP